MRIIERPLSIGQASIAIANARVLYILKDDANGRL